MDFLTENFDNKTVSKQEIQLINIKPEETIPHSIIILKGIITNTSTCTNNHPKDGFIRITLIGAAASSINYKVIDNKFKILFELSPGKNSIKVNYYSLSKEFNLYYHEPSTNNNTKTILPLYIICDGHNGRFQAPSNENNSIESACKRIMLGAKLLQAICAEKFNEEKLKRKTFNLETNCLVFKTKLNLNEANKLSQEDLWKAIGREILSSDYGRENRKYLGFLSCTKYCGANFDENMTRHEEILNLTQGNVALGGGGLALLGTGCLFTWPEELLEVQTRIEDSTVVDKHQFLDDSCYRGTYGACFSTTLGSALHELCHTFDLGHTETGIMGRGFDFITKVLTINDSLNESSSNISIVFQTNIEFKEKFDSSTKLSERLENKPKELLVKNHKLVKENDETFWMKNCLLLLYYHKWFNNTISRKEARLKFDLVTKFVTSTEGLRVIEIRSETNQMVLSSWVFDGLILKYSFQIPDDKLVSNGVSNKLLVVEDNEGNIIKVTLPSNSFRLN